MGGGGGKGGSSTSTSQVSIPPEVLARYNAVNARAEQAAAQPFQAYSTDPSAFVAPLTAPQEAGISQTMAAAGQAQPYYGFGTGLSLAGAAPAYPGPLETGRYMSPFLSDVYGTQLAGQALLGAQQRSGLAGQAIGAGAYGGDRYGIAQANLAYQQNLANAQANAQLLQSGYTQAQNVAQQQQAQQLAAQQQNLARLSAAGQQIAGLGAGAQQAALQGAQAQLGAGQVAQQTQQAGLAALYNQFLQQQGYPFQVAQFLANIAEGTGALSGQTTTTTQPAPFFSDERLKDDIEPIGETYDGQKIVKFRYKGHPQKQIGLVAQDVEKKHPEAVGLAAGYKTVDYDKATQDSAHMGKASGGLVPHSEGGHVLEEHAGEGYALGGMTETEIAKILSEAKQTRPYQDVGLYGGRLGSQGPYRSGLAPANIRRLSASATPIAREYTIPSTLFAEGGAVHKADGGGLDWGQLLTMQRQGYEGMPWAQAGKGGLNIPMTPPTKPTPLQAAPPPKPQESELSQIMGGLSKTGEAIKGVREIGKTGSDVYDWMSKPSGTKYDPNSIPAAPTEEEQAMALSAAYGLSTGGLARAHYAAGGLPYGAADPYVPEELTKEEPPKKPQSSPQGGLGGGGSDGLSEMVGLAAGLAPYAAMLLKNGGRAGYGLGGNPTDPDPNETIIEEPLNQGSQPLKQLPSNVPGEYRFELPQPKRITHPVFDPPVPANEEEERGSLGDIKTEQPTITHKGSRQFNLGTAPATAAVTTPAPAPAPAPAVVDSTEGQGPSALGDFWRSLVGDRAYRPTTIGGDIAQALSSEKFLVPVLSGLEGMVSSPSRYLGSAVLRGLGTGAKTYEDILTSQPVREKVGAEAQQEQIKAVNDLTNGWMNYRALTGQDVTLDQYAKIVGYRGPSFPTPQTTEQATMQTEAQPSYKYTPEEYNRGFVERDGYKVPLYNDPSYLSGFISRNAGIQAPFIKSMVDTAKLRLNEIQTKGSTTDVEGKLIPISGAFTLEQLRKTNEEISKNVQQRYADSQAVEQGYDRTRSLIDLMADASRLSDVNVASPQAAEFIGRLRSLPGADRLIDDALAKKQISVELLAKGAISQALNQMSDIGTTAQKTVLENALSTVAKPGTAPETRKALLAKQLALLDREKDRSEAWVSTYSQARGFAEPQSFFATWDRNPANSLKEYEKRARESLGMFAGERPLGQ